ncbi:hypothetical protein BOX15_Mlig012712g1 [Macrostomum lignano]|uniref:Glycoside hydrolase family 38 N-terminal domain-containing protein n=1 Tax=Macrostomum lignano TaxID=282301 RepID=A0A267G5B8_9PLAT|nr:hypothetical protein BOX15_Mlig012712g1 [Macrostomum lignano]
MQVKVNSTGIMLLLIMLLFCTATANGALRKERVHVIFMNHLDVGYNGIPDTGYINNVLNRYFHVHFPQALSLVKQIREGGFRERFRYTTHPWLLDMYLNCPDLILNGIQLQCPNSTDLEAMKDALTLGDIVWHAGPMNMQIENMKGALLEASLNISRRLDEKFQPEKKIRVLSQRDVPGMTSAAIPVLKKNNIVAVSVGVNPASYPPEVTREPFVWLDELSQESIVGIWHPGGYPNEPGNSPANPGGISVKDCSMVSGVPEILCFSFRTDNQGPPQSVAEVLNSYEILRDQFNGAEVIASTLEDFVQAILPYQSLMQVVRTEIGDTWIQGIASDPRKMAEYRALSRAFTRCRSDGACSGNDPQVQDAVRYMIKPPEHTWGLPSQPDQNNYRNVDFNKARSGSAYVQNENAWLEQRMFNTLAVQAAKGHPLSSYMAQEMSQLTPTLPDMTGYVKQSLQPDAIFEYGYYRFSFFSDGSIDHLQINGGQSFANQRDRLAKFVYRSYDELDDNKLLRSYGNPGYGKPNITANANPLSLEWRMLATDFYRKPDNSSFVIVVVPEDSLAVSDYGAPQKVFLTYNFSSGIDVDVLVWNKTSTRIEEGLFVEFRASADMADAPNASCRWLLNKVDGYVDPMRVTYGGSILQHAINEHAVFSCEMGASKKVLVVQSKDVPLACPFSRFQEASVFPYLDRLTRVDGVSFNIYNNVWITNYIFWYPYHTGDQNFKARFSLLGM